MKNRRVGRPHTGHKHPYRRRWERLAISAVRVLLIVAAGLALMWAMGWLG